MVRVRRLVIAISALTGAGLLVASYWDGPGRADPRTIHEAIEVADAQGLFWLREGHGTGVGERLLVSELPLTADRARDLVTTRVTTPRWDRTVAIYSDWRNTPVEQFGPGYGLIWGELVVCGDPRLIQKLTGRLTAGR
jgi:hypothetical protein